MRYSVRPENWYPEGALRALTDSRRCCVGVSVGQPAFRGRRLLSLLGWLEGNAESVLFLVGDQILRHTIQLEMGVGEEGNATVLALDRGKVQIETIADAAHAFPGIQIEILPISKIIATPEFGRNWSWIEELDQSNSDFSKSLTRTAQQYLKTYSSQGRHRAVDHDTAVRLCRRYLKEELAAFSVIHERGWLIDVYPGPELPVLLEIAQGKYPDAPYFLKNRISISLEHVRHESALHIPSEARYASSQPTC
ncbi:MAG: tRNA-dependent cyclodipeptide synthase [Candidatus Sulfopaludibacter sp.]|nr:tRNA-dependent cyclodipeptide synthase [Candidatus Sulfopaludibacter sp.]